MQWTFSVHNISIPGNHWRQKQIPKFPNHPAREFPASSQLFLNYSTIILWTAWSIRIADFEFLFFFKQLRIQFLPYRCCLSIDSY